MTRNLLLLSNSQAPGVPYLAHAFDAIREWLDGRTTIHFVPYALADRDGYAARQQAALDPIGVTVVGVHTAKDPAAEIDAAEAIYVGGGNSFRLLKNLQQRHLIAPIKRRVMAGDLPYMGSSAGTNMACPTIRTTNDMPITQPESLESIGLIPFQINPHYEDPDPTSTHQGETRQKRLEQFLEDNDVPVAAIREGTWLRVVGDSVTLHGEAGGFIFRRNHDLQPIANGDDLSFLLDLRARFDVGVG